ncbi:hypothetical protein BCR41DRAFT_383645 [Lobosporangium transversale]|uniref:Uncharacterized protein n=1 Tax=Lobosporangium transversale TaxID=64571 RepID=A0A1Y2H0C2_9FUNG|nr:hypothetical protein BCR41DRAFT_383645 [Lobosporangium transversale]ORZ27999.1 hypothetical protein BCR41DRAFT_383645 [Lobosporangium transversale]|eukprot:XP_021885702.1 hypothetical protein BCR41DRAFT_383645 [Lobosporangium transversale]
MSDSHRVRPHGIKYHPGVLLDVIYGQTSLSTNQFLSTESKSSLIRNYTPFSFSSSTAEADQGSDFDEDALSNVTTAAAMNKLTTTTVSNDLLTAPNTFDLQAQSSAATVRLSDTLAAEEAYRPAITVNDPDPVMTPSASEPSTPTLKPNATAPMTKVIINDTNQSGDTKNCSLDKSSDYEHLRVSLPEEVYNLLEPIFRALREVDAAMDIISSGVLGAVEKETLLEAQVLAHTRLKTMVDKMVAAYGSVAHEKILPESKEEQKREQNSRQEQKSGKGQVRLKLLKQLQPNLRAQISHLEHQTSASPRPLKLESELTLVRTSANDPILSSPEIKQKSSAMKADMNEINSQSQALDQGRPSSVDREEQPMMDSNQGSAIQQQQESVVGQDQDPSLIASTTSTIATSTTVNSSWAIQSEGLKKEITRLAAMKQRANDRLEFRLRKGTLTSDDKAVADEREGIELELELIEEKQRKLFGQLYQIRQKRMWGTTSTFPSENGGTCEQDSPKCEQQNQKETNDPAEEEPGDDRKGSNSTLKTPIRTKEMIFEQGRASLTMSAFEVQRTHGAYSHCSSWEERARSIEKAVQAMWTEEGGLPICHLSIVDVVAHRGKDILAQRYGWLDSPCPHLFVLLPCSDDYSDRTTKTALKWQDFMVCFLCECGDLPCKVDNVTMPCSNRRDGNADTCLCLPHIDFDNIGHTLSKDAKELGPHMMAVLEMLLYGVTIEGAVKMAPIEDNDERKKIMLSIQFLMEQGVETSHQLISRGYTSLNDIQVIAPLTGAQLTDFYRTGGLSLRRPIPDFSAFRSLEGDLRWLCYKHYHMHKPLAAQKLLSQFKDHPDSKLCCLHVGLGSLVATIRTRERAKEFFDIVQQMVAIPAVSVFLDWDFTTMDVLDLLGRIPSLSVSCLKIYIREHDFQEKDEIFGHRYHYLILVAIKNKNIQACAIERRAAGGENTDTVDELFTYKGVMYLDPIVAWFTRESMSPKVQLGILVADLSSAANAIRMGLRGFHTLSKLTLEASYWDHIHIEFGQEKTKGDDAKEESEEEEEDENYATESQVNFFNRRQNDAITVRTYHSGNNEYLLTHALKEVNIRISFPEDGPRIRELIKNNKRLKMLELVIACKDDPCQVFEYFKALMHNHPSMESLHLCKDWGKTNKSTFVWYGVSDRSKMTLSIMSYLEDKIGPLLQKFGACLLQLFINNINATDAAILEKVTRSRKGQLKLATIALVDLFTIATSSLDELAKVVLRTPLQQFRLTGTVISKNATRVSEFMAKVATKITEIHFYGESTKAVLTELEKRMPESSNMVLLQELRLSGPFAAATKDLTWTRSLLNKTQQPLKTIELHKVNLSHQGWMTLAQEIDFKRLKYLRIGPDTPMKNEAIRAFVMAVPLESELENFHLDSDGLPKAYGLAYKNILMPQLKKKTALVSIGRHF